MVRVNQYYKDNCSLMAPFDVSSITLELADLVNQSPSLSQDDHTITETFRSRLPQLLLFARQQLLILTRNRRLFQQR